MQTRNVVFVTAVGFVAGYFMGRYLEMRDQIPSEDSPKRKSRSISYEDGKLIISLKKK